MVLNLFFLFLTWYSAYFDKVTDCGCFGDAIKLSPWETFYKNIVLVLLIIFLVKKVKEITLLMSLNLAKWTSFLSFSVFLYIVYHVLIHLPLIDFRPYAVGKNINEGMQYIGDKEPPIHDFFLESNDGEDMTAKILEKDKVLLIVSYNLSKSDKESYSNIKTMTDQAIENGYEVYMLSSSMYEEYEAVKNEFKLNFDALFCDETTLKTIIRANPGILILQNGTVTGKWSWVDIENVTF